MQYKLESLRGLAACLVVLYHSGFNFGESKLTFLSNSYLFVDFFFILSGYVMSAAYYSRISQGMDYRAYMVLRLGRVYPLHLIMLLIWIPYIVAKQYLFESGFGGTTQLDKNNVMSFFSNVFLINSMGVHHYLSWNYPAWSISTEFFTYIVFFVLTTVIDKNRSLVIPLLIAVGCYGFLASLNRNNLNITYDYGFFRCLGAFYLGVFVHRLSESIQLSETKIIALEIFCVMAIVTTVSLTEIHFLMFIPVIIIFSLSIFVFSQNGSGFIGKALLTRPLKSIGAWSYSIYMIHAIVLAGISNVFQYIFKWNIESPMGFYSTVINCCVLLVVIVISKYSYSLIENPIREKSRLIARKYNKSMQPTAEAAAD